MELPPFLVEFLQALAAGITLGCAYALMCIGLGIIFGSMRVINFAQGDFLMLGMYVAFYLTTGYGILTFLGKEAVERAGLADRVKVADAIRTIDLTSGPAALSFPGPIRFDEKGRRVVDVPMIFAQWQNGIRSPSSRPSWR